MALKDSFILDLPSAPEFISKPPQYTCSEMIELCTPLLPYWNEQRYSKPRPRFLGEPFCLDSPTNSIAVHANCDDKAT
jgi:hypothetical protein